MSKEAMGWYPDMDNLPDIVKYYLHMNQKEIPSRLHSKAVVIKTLNMLKRHGHLRLTTVELTNQRPISFYKLIQD